MLVLQPRFLDQHHVQVGLLFGVILGPIVGVLCSQWPNVNDAEVCKDISELYLEGKMKQYSLLFSVMEVPSPLFSFPRTESYLVS